jgi:dihydroorotate dehydrogenase
MGLYSLVRPLLFKADAEWTHHQMITVGKMISQHRFFQVPLDGLYHYEDPRLEVGLFGKRLRNPIGTAAGFDKNAELGNVLTAVGFGFAEVGSITAQASQGNPTPRLFRLPPDQAIINRMGLNNYGADYLAHTLANRTTDLPIAVNIAKTHDPKLLGDAAIADFCHSVKTLYPYGQCIVLNISCPNTAEGKTFEEPAALEALLQAVREVEQQFPERKPILLKLSPDISFKQLDNILAIAQRYNIAGYVISNTSSQRTGLTTPAQHIAAIGKGGLSGKPLQQSSTAMIKYVYQHGNQPFIIGVGGIFSAADAYSKIKAGASLVELYTGLIYQGPGIVKQIKRGLVELLIKDGFKSIEGAVGTAA